MNKAEIFLVIMLGMFISVLSGYDSIDVKTCQKKFWCIQMPGSTPKFDF